MQLIVIFRELWGRRIFVVLTLLVSVAIGVEVAYRVTPGLPPQLASRQHDVGVASARVLVDTPSSIVADLNPNGGASLSVHAQLLADLIASEPVRAAIAAAAGIPQQNLVVLTPSIVAPIQTPVVSAVAPPAGASSVSLAPDATLPIVAINAQAPDAVQAAKLADGTVSALRSYLQSVDVAQKIRPSFRVVLTPLGTAQAAEATQGRSPLFGLAAAFVVFALFCYIIGFTSGVRRRLHADQPDPELAAQLPSDDWQPAIAVQDASEPVPSGNDDRQAISAASKGYANGAIHPIAASAGSSRFQSAGREIGPITIDPDAEEPGMAGRVEDANRAIHPIAASNAEEPGMAMAGRALARLRHSARRRIRA